jgi:epimerase transport system membrane fusion protein
VQIAMNNNDAEAILVDDSRFRRIGGLIVLVVFGIFGLWATLAPLNSAAIAPGEIKVEGYRKTIQHLEGGIVRSIQVDDGDRVDADQVLIVLDDRQPKTQLQVMLGQYYVLLAREARLLAQQQDWPDIEFPLALTENKDDSRVRELIDMQQHNFNVRKNANEGEISLYRRQMEQLNARIKGLKSQRNSQYRLVESYREELKDFERLIKEGYTEKQRVREFERNLAESEGTLGELVSSIAEAEVQISGIELEVVQLTKDFQREVAAELSEVQGQLFELREQIHLLRDTVERTVVRAPVAGMVMGLSVHTVGAVVAPGADLLEIVPQGDELVIEARVSPVDIDRISEGQSAEVRLTAFKARDTPKLEASVVSVSADSMQDERRGADDEPFFLARLKITDESRRYLDQASLSLMPGMPADVLILTGDRTMLQYLLEPLTATISHSFVED